MDVKVVSSVISPAYIKKHISTSYNIDEIVNCELLQSTINDTYKIETVNQDYILKIYKHNYKTTPEISFEIEFVSYLKFANLDVAHYIKKINGDFISKIHSPEGVRYAVMTVFADGNELEYMTKKDAYLYGLSLAKIHKASENFKPTKKMKEIDINLMLQTSIKSIEIFLKKQYPNELEYFQYFFDNIVHKLQNMDSNNLEKVFCHGDLHGGNIHKQLDKVIFFDFDFCGYGLMGYDISVFRWGCMIGDRNHLWKEFIQGYKSIRKLEDKDLEYSLLFVIIRDLWIMHLYLNRIDAMGQLFIYRFYIQNRINFLKNIESRF